MPWSTPRIARLVKPWPTPPLNHLLLVMLVTTCDGTFTPVGRNCSANDGPNRPYEEGGCGALICEDDQCRACMSDGECQIFNGPEHACLQLNGKGVRICAHKRFLPMDTRDYIAIGLAILLCAISAGGGIGGGGLLLPMLILLLEFRPHDASPLANATVLGGAVANLLYYTHQLHPSGRRPLISFEVALMMEPMTMAGALGGVLLNKTFPGWLITVLLVTVLGLTTHRTLKKGIATWQKESAAAAMAANNPEAGTALLSAPYPASPPTGIVQPTVAGECDSIGSISLSEIGDLNRLSEMSAVSAEDNAQSLPHACRAIDADDATLPLRACHGLGQRRFARTPPTLRLGSRLVYLRCSAQSLATRGATCGSCWAP